MYDSRLELLVKLGYSPAEAEGFAERFPLSFTKAIEEAGTPEKAREILVDSLAREKASIYPE